MKSILSALLLFITSLIAPSLPATPRVTIDSTEQLQLDAGQCMPMGSLPQGATMKIIEVGFTPKCEAQCSLTVKLASGEELTASCAKIELNKGDFDQRSVLRVKTYFKGQQLLSTDIDKDVAATATPIFLRLEQTATGLAVSIGHRYLTTISTLTEPSITDAIDAEVAAIGGHIEIVRRYMSLLAPRQRCHLSAEQLDERISLAHNLSTLDGATWSYLDNEIDTALASRGGDYRLATVATAEGFELVYLSGATISPKLWQQGDIKGLLSPSPVSGSYNLQWIDSDLNTDYVDAQANIDGDILTLVFPYEGARLRFIRIR